jgi:hypothetical protein
VAVSFAYECARRLPLLAAERCACGLAPASASYDDGHVSPFGSGFTGTPIVIGASGSAGVNQGGDSGGFGFA